MSGIIGHTIYALLGEQSASARRLPIVALLRRYRASYLCGAYLGCDIQTLPEAVCVDTGREVGYGTVPMSKSPITGGAVRPWTLSLGGCEYTALDIHRLFYGRSHVVFGWSQDEQNLQQPWDHLAEYFGCAAADARKLFLPCERQLAYHFGTLAHIVGDGLIESIHPGLSLHLLDGSYTPRNRPVQDLVAFHEIGRKELRLDWEALLQDMADAPIEPLQAHTMRAGEARGELGQRFDQGWRPDLAPLLDAVMSKNRQYLRVLIPGWLEELKLVQTNRGLDCSEAMRGVSGLHYDEMLAVAKEADFRHALWQIGESVADLFAAVIESQPLFDSLSSDTSMWDGLIDRWHRKEPK